MTRFRIVVALAGALALGVFTPAIATLLRHGGAARSFGWTAAPQGDVWFVEDVDATGPAASRVRVSDRLVSLDGDTLVSRYGPLRFLRTIPIGSPYRLRVERDGREIEETLTVGAGRRTLGPRLVYLFVSLVWCGVGLFIGWARPDDAVARIAFAAAVSTAIVYLTVGVVPGTLPGPTYQPFHMVLAYHFFYRFPAGVERGRFSRALLLLVYAWALVVFAMGQPQNWVYLTEGAGAAAAWVEQNAKLLRLRQALAAVLAVPLIIGSVALMATTYRRHSDANTRRRIRWVVYPSAVALLPLLVWSAFSLAGVFAQEAPSPILQRAWLVVDLATNAGTVLIPIGVAFAVVRHQLFDITVVIRRGLQYLLARRALQVLLGLPTVALAVTVVVHRNLTIGQLLTQNVRYLWLIAAFGLSLKYREPLSRWLDRRFFREQHDREQVLVRLLDDIGRLNEPDDITHLVRAQVDHALHPTATWLWFDGDPDPPPEPLLSRIAREGASPDAPLTSGAHLPDGICIVVPLTGSDERLAGVLMLGGKRSEEPYSSNDLSLLGVVAKQAAVVRENLRLRERISEERRIRTDVLAHLEPDRVDLVKECPDCGSCHDSTDEHCSRDGKALRLSLPVTRIVAGRYRLDRLIGRGGMGVVYEAHDLRLERTVAIKFLLGPAFGQEHSLRRFRREARAIARIHHPNIVEVYDYGGLEPHGAYLVMERIRGVTLREEMTRQGALAGATAAEWFAPLLDGIAAAHEEGIIHRDLKPENVARVRPEYGPPVVKILDFGIAKMRPLDTASDRLTATGTVVGTLGYMSPEQLRGLDVDARSDLFAVGVMVVEALTGSWPFQGTSYAQLLAAIVLEPYHLPGDAPEVRALDTVLQRCLAKERGDRFVSAAALRHELVPALRTSPVPVPPPPTS